MINRHKGWPAVVLGNGPSRIMPSITPGVIAIGCNKGGWVKPVLDYCVILDRYGMAYYQANKKAATARRFVCEPDWREQWENELSRIEDFELFKPDVPNYQGRMFSGPYALLLAMHFGCDPIGFAGFAEPGNYFDTIDDMRYVHSYPQALSTWTRQWIKAYAAKLGRMPVFLNMGGGDAL